MRWLVIGVAVLLAGCQSEAQKAELRYRTAEAAHDNDAMCREGRKVADAYLSTGETPKYQQWKGMTDISCITAEYDNRNR